MEFKGTKGKWDLHENITLNNQSGFYMQSIGSDLDNKMLVSNSYGHTEEECLSNAKLISKAPEMLEMLVDIRDWIDKDINVSECRTQIDELIKEATTI